MSRSDWICASSADAGCLPLRRARARCPRDPPQGHTTARQQSRSWCRMRLSPMFASEHSGKVPRLCSLLALSPSPIRLELVVLVLAVATAGAVLFAAKWSKRRGPCLPARSPMRWALGRTYCCSAKGIRLWPGALVLILVGLYLIEPQERRPIQNSLRRKSRRSFVDRDVCCFR